MSMALIIVLSLILAVTPILLSWLVDAYVDKRRAMIKPVFAVAAPDSQRDREIASSFRTSWIHGVLFCGFVAGGVIRVPDDETWTQVLATFLVAFVWTEIWHYLSHRLMHWEPLHFIHAEHHKSMITAPWTANSFSILEKTLFSVGILGGLTLLSSWWSLSVTGIFGYYMLYFYTNTLGHANFEFRDAGYYARFWGQVFNCPTYHALHHARYVKNYGLITPWLDRIFGTEWQDVSSVQSRAASGRPLTSKSERGST